MKRFADLYEALDRTTATNQKVAALVRYLGAAPAADAAWALYFLTGRRLLRLLPSRQLHEWAVESSGLPEWLVQECYGVVGDFAETVALLLDGGALPVDADARAPSARPSRRGATARLPFDDPVPVAEPGVAEASLAVWIEQRIQPLRAMTEADRRRHVRRWWTVLDRRERFLLNKLLTGEFRVGVSRTLVVRAVAELAGLPPPVVDFRLMGAWPPTADGFRQLVQPAGPDDDPSRPYPFCLASPLQQPAESLGPRDEWLAEWKWDGIRAQVIVRGGDVFIWSRGEELVTDRFPEIAAAARRLPAGTVLDGEILAHGDGMPRAFADLQRRIGRQRQVRETAQDVPVVLVVYDLLEADGRDVRGWPLHERRARLTALVPAAAAGAAMTVSEALAEADWAGLAGRRAEARARRVEGLMLKRWSSPYRAGRKRGDWWKWKIDPHTVDAVLVYAQPGSGRRASLFTDYTFGVWAGGELVPVAKAYSGLTDAEIDELDRWIRRHTVERFGPVSAVEPLQVFELGFERLARSTRHRSGVAVRFPRILRWRRDKRPDQADTLDQLHRLLDADGDP